MDTSNQHGRWIDEQQYNKRNNRRTLTGNWFETRILEESLDADANKAQAEKIQQFRSNSLDVQHTFENYQKALELTEKHAKLKSSVLCTTDHRGQRTLLFNDEQTYSKPSKRMFESTPYLIHGNEPMGKSPDNRETFISTHRAEFKKSDTKQRLIGKGARTKFIEDQMLREAVEQVEHEESELHDTLIYAPQERKKTTFERTRHGESSSDNELSRDSRSYFHDEPITFYSHQQERSAVQNNTETGPSLFTNVYHSRKTGVHRWSKNTSFSQPIHEYTRAPIKMDN